MENLFYDYTIIKIAIDAITILNVCVAKMNSLIKYNKVNKSTKK